MRQIRIRSLAAVMMAAAALAGTEALPEEAEAQHATAEDMIRLFEPMIGVFRSPDFLYDDGKTEHHFTISYEWFDREKTIVRFRVTTEIPSLTRTLVSSEGFYRFDPARERIAVFAAFTNGDVGTGAIVEFDHEAGKHTLIATNVARDGRATHVRDAFERIDASSWRNRTAVRSNGEEWKVVHEGAYTRVQDGSGDR